MTPRTPKDYLALIPQQHHKPRFLATVRAFVEPFCELQRICAELAGDAYDLDKAVGAQLDVIAKWVGVTRANTVPLESIAFTWDGRVDNGWDNGAWEGVAGFTQLPDDLFRALIKAKIIANHGRFDKGTVYAIIEEACAATNVCRVLENEEIGGFTDWFTWDGNNSNGWDRGAWEMQISDIMTMMVVVKDTVPAALLAFITAGALPIKPSGVTAYYTVTGE